MGKLRIVAKDAGIIMTAILNDSQTTKKLLEVLPVDGKAQTWGDEIYFEVPVKMSEENPHAAVDVGAIAYWPPGHAFCVFFGQEPYSPVNVLGKLEGDPKLFARVRSGDSVRLEKESAKGEHKSHKA